MALIQNNFRDAWPSARYFGATLSNGASPYIASPSTNNAGGQRNIFLTDAGIDPLSSKPAGARNPVAFQLPQKAGGLASRKVTRITFDDTGTAVLGLPGSGSSTITFTPTATGGLIVSGSGSASITLDATGTVLSVAAGSGSATITLSGTALIGALAGVSGTASITLTPAATILAVGYLSGISTNETEFSADALAAAVWNALTADFNTAGTMGEMLNNAGAGGNPWDALTADNTTSGSFGEFVQKLLTVGKFLGLK